MKKVTVLPYSSEWQRSFCRIKTILEAGLCGIHCAIEHVGSTSIPGMVAKPIIDIDVVIDRRDFGETKNRLKTMGYVHEGDLGIMDREAFDLTDATRRAGLPEHHLYVCPHDSEELRRHIAFRDYLRTHPEQRAELSSLKQQLVRRHRGNPEAYMAGKDALVKRIIALALARSSGTQR